MLKHQVLDGWKIGRLGELVDITMGQSPSSSTYNQNGTGLPFFQGKAGFGEIFPVIAKYCSKPLRIAEPNDILMSVRAPVGPVNISPAKCCIGRGLCALRAKKDRLDQTYLFFYLRSIEMNLPELGQGSTFGAIGKKDIEEIEVPYPVSLETQRQIASVLEKARLLRQKREQANQLTNKIIWATFSKMFGDLSTNPKGWEMRRLEDICHRVTDGTHKTPKYVSDGVPFLSVKNITSGYLDFSDIKFITQEEHAEITKRCKPERGDILYTKVGTIGIASVVDTDREFSIFVSIALLKPKHEIVNSAYLKWMLNSSFVKNQANRRVKGIGVPDLHLVEIKDFTVAIPPLNEQEVFAKFVARAEALRQKQMQSTQEITELFNSLMFKAFRGELVA